MAGTIVNNMTEIHDAENNTGWDATYPDFQGFQREDTTCLGGQASAGPADVYYNLTSVDLSGSTIHGWILLWNNPDTLANGGFGIQVGDGTNRAGFPTAGSDRSAFAKNAVGWGLANLSVPDKDDAAAINLAGITASIDDTAITQIGYYLNATGKALGNTENAFWDILWYYSHAGYAIEITAGTSGSPATFNDLADWDASTAASRAVGVLFEMAANVFEQYAPIQIGDDGTGSSYFSSSNQEVIFADILNINNHKLAVVGNSTGTNEAYFTTVTFRNTSAEVTPTLTFNGGNINNLEFDGCIFLDITPTFSSAADATGHSVSGCVFDGCGATDTGDVVFTNNTFSNSAQVTHNGNDMSDSKVLLSTVAAGIGALLYNETADPDGEMDNMTFSQGTNAHSAIEFGASVTANITLRGIDFTGFGSTDDINGAMFKFLATSGSLNLNLVGCTTDGAFSVDDSAGITVTVVINPVTEKVNVKNTSGTNIQNARVFVETAEIDAAGEIYEAAVTSLTQSVGTATCTTTAVHGLVTGDKVVIRGAQPDGYNKVATTTVSSTTVFTYTVDSGLSSPATGTPIVSFVALHGLTDVNGDISASRTWTSAQALKGWARKKNTATPFYKDGNIAYTVDITNGNTTNVVLQSDE